MFRLVTPAGTGLERFLSRARLAPLSYGEVGATRNSTLPPGYRHDRYESDLAGRDGFERARDGLARWQAHLGAGARLFPDCAVAEGETILVLFALGPLQMVAPCRVVYVVDEVDRFGFAYGTLPGHPECGEEAFVVEQEDGRCVFRITAFSRPDGLLVRMAAPVARRVQTAMTRRYLDALGRFVGEGHGPS